MSKKRELRLYDFTPLLAAIFIVSSLVLIGVSVMMIMGGTKSSLIGGIILAVVTALAIGYTVWEFVFSPVILTPEGVKKGKKFIAAEKAKFKEEYNLRFKEKKIVFYDKTLDLSPMDVKAFDKASISVQNVKGYIGKIRRFYGEGKND